MQPKKWLIYTLKDPRTQEVRYVGFTSRDTRSRLLKHINDAINSKRRIRRNNWILSLVSIGLNPIVEEVEIGSGAGWQDVERRWIAFYRANGARLVNATTGGEGVIGWGTPEQRSIRAKKRADALTPEQRSDIARRGQANRTPEERSESAKNRWAAKTSEERTAIAKRSWAGMTPEQRTALAGRSVANLTHEERSARAHKRWNNMTPEQREQFSEMSSARNKKRWSAMTPEQRTAHAKHMATKGWITRRAAKGNNRAA